jgi:hypothetical protein
VYFLYGGARVNVEEKIADKNNPFLLRSYLNTPLNFFIAPPYKKEEELNFS